MAFQMSVFILALIMKQPDEQIISGSPADFLEQTFSALSLIYIENPDAEPLPVTYGLSDDAFIRGKVPMTNPRFEVLFSAN